MENYSVLMSVYHKEKPEYLRQSIQSMLDQTVPTNDFVLVCDGPLTPELDALIDMFYHSNPNLFQIIRLQKNGGLGLALNEGIGYCKNELVARMDSDDISLPNRCEEQLKIFEKIHVDIVSGYLREFDNDVNKITAIKIVPQSHAEIANYAKRRNPFNHPCVMYRKKAVLKAGSYQHFYSFEDYYLWVRMLRSGAQGYNIPKTLLLMRAGSEMYKRRGGLKYIAPMVKFRFFMLACGFVSIFDFLICVAGQSVLCLFPHSLREKIYKYVLRN